MKVLLYKNDNSEPVEVLIKKIIILDESDSPIAVAHEIKKNHYMTAHAGDDDFIPILLQSGYKGKLPQRIRLKQTESGLVIPV
jgi:hypothetical protein